MLNAKELGNYVILEEIFQNQKTIIYSAKNKKNSKRVIIKLYNKENLIREEVSRYEYEFSILKNLNIDGIIKPISLEYIDQRPFLVMEEFPNGGISLKNTIRNYKFDLKSSLKIAIEICRVLYFLHKENIIHRDIKPSNIIIDKESLKIKIIDFDLSTKFKSEKLDILHINSLTGSLQYISPEQTGRINRNVDFRTDLYSLGISFYEFFTGKLPFQSEDSMALIHQHIANQPIPPFMVNSEIPITLSNIILKLISKTPENRYQSAYGVQADLERLLENLQQNSFKFSSLKDFAIAENDVPDQFIFQEKLYERDKEIEFLEQSFLLASEGTPQVIMVSGYPGIGKSSLFKEISKRFIQKKAVILVSKYTEYNKSAPYSALIQSFRNFIKEILTEQESSQTRWKNEIELALGENIAEITRVIPELELIVGKKVFVKSLDFVESNYRFNLAFLTFIKVFAKPNEPLVIFLDDLQWVDSSSLNLLKVLLTAKEDNHLLFIGSFRENEVDFFNPSSYHPIKFFINDLANIVQHIFLGPLSKRSIERIILDTISTAEDVSELSEIILNKTSGNPFFVIEILKSLFEKKLIFFEYFQESKFSNYKIGKWSWNIEQIKNEAITNNVIDLMIEKISKLSESTRNLLKLASCLNYEFDLHTLSIINEKSYVSTSTQLWEAIQIGLILPKGNVHLLIRELGDKSQVENIISAILKSKDQFLHDKVRNAAYSLLNSTDLKKTHLTIGRLLFENSSEEELETRIFEITSHLNIGKEFLTDSAEIRKLLDLNFQAGEKAFLTHAYLIAIDFFKNGIDLIKAEIWNLDFKLAYNIHYRLGESYCSIGNYYETNYYIQILLKKTSDPIQLSSIYSLLIKIYNLSGDYERATETASLALRLLHIKLPNQNMEFALKKEFEKAETYLNNRNSTILINASPMTIPEKLVAMDVLTSITSTAYLFNPELYPIVVLKLVTHSLKYGNTGQSCFGYATYGLILGSIKNDYKKGYDFGWLALTLSEKLNAKNQKCKAAVLFANYISPWQRHISNSNPINEEAVAAGIECGDMQFAGYALVFKLYNAFYLSSSLEHILEDSERSFKFNEDSKNIWSCDLIRAIQLILSNLILKTDLVNEFYYLEQDEVNFFKNSEKNKSSSAVCLFYILKIETFFIHRELNEAHSLLAKTETLLPTILGQIETSEFYFFQTLIWADSFPDLGANEKETILDKITANLIRFKYWSENSPENFSCRYKLLQAESKRIRGGGIDCLYNYDEAILAAQVSGFKHIEAIAQELTGRFLIQIGKSKLARVYLKDSKYSYSHWGAIRKIELLNKEFSDLLRIKDSRSQLDFNEISHTLKPETLDMNTALKASRVIASEIQLSALLQRTIHILVENAGAERGILILKHEKEHEFFVQAEYMATTKESLVLQSTPISDAEIPLNIIKYVIGTKDNLIISDAYKDQYFYKDKYIFENKLKSILCTPFLHQGNLLGILYLENNLISNAFTAERLELLHIIASQVVVSMNNAFIYANLEREVDRRTQQANESLSEIKLLKEHQDGDYYLTSLLLKPLSQNTAVKNNLEVKSFVRQKKEFSFKKTKDEIGGDICISDTIKIQDKEMTAFIIADAMGKSIQGAGGALVLGAVFKSILERSKIDESIKNNFPENWLQQSFIELHRVFVSFEGMMLIAGILGIIDNSTGLLYYLNFENPLTVLYRNRKASFIVPNQILRKLGSFGTERNRVSVQTFQLKDHDVLINGSDGRDDLILGKDSDGFNITNIDDRIFLESVEDSESVLEEIYNQTKRKGILTDDFSLNRIEYKSVSKYPISEETNLLTTNPEFYELLTRESKINYLRNLFKDESLNPNLYKSIGFEFKRIHDFKYAISAMEKYFRFNPGSETNLFALALSYRKIKDFQKSLSISKILHLRNNQNLANLLNIAECYQKINRIDLLKKTLSEIFSIQPENKSAIRLSKKNL